MKIRGIILSGLLLLSGNLFAQNNFNCFVKDAENKDALAGVTAKITGGIKATASDNNGSVVFKNIAAGNIKIIFSFVGYESQTISFQIPQGDTVQIIYLQKAAEKTEEEVIINSSRTNSRIEDLPTKVEVLGSEEVDEEAGTIPGNIASLLGDIAGIQNQRTSGTTGSIDLRVQGLPGKYTQILRDGLHFYFCGQVFNAAVGT